MLKKHWRANFAFLSFLTDKKIKLENWKDINVDEIESIKCEFDDSFRRITVNGDNRLGFYTKGEPLIITLIDQKIYLLINWNFIIISIYSCI